MSYVFRTLIVTASEAPLAREVAGSFGEGSQGMFNTPLSASGQNPATHYISTGYVAPEYEELVPLQTWEKQEDGSWVMVSSSPGDPIAVYTIAASAGVVTTQDDVDALFASSDVTEQEPFVAMNRLGLSIINPPLNS